VPIRQKWPLETLWQKIHLDDFLFDDDGIASLNFLDLRSHSLDDAAALVTENNTFSGPDIYCRERSYQRNLSGTESNKHSCGALSEWDVSKMKIFVTLSEQGRFELHYLPSGSGPTRTAAIMAGVTVKTSA
jgi:hypothetical protein